MLARKLALLLNEKLPGKRVYFVYTHKNGYDRFHHGLRANTEISYWSFHALKKAFPRVTFLRFQGEKKERIEKIQSSDVVIGHMGPTMLEASRRTKKIISFAPFVGHEDHCISKGPHCSNMEEEMAAYERAAALIFLTSEYNKREYIENNRNFWYPFLQKLKKPLRIVHQPVDLKTFKRIKTDYKTSHFLYIGHFGHMKGVEMSRKLVKEVGRTLHIFGSEDRRFDNLDIEQVRVLPQMADFFIQPGMWEGQCVAILEAAARGFIPVVSPETGYPYDHPYLLRYDDYDYNLATLKKLLATSAEERKELGDFLYQKLTEDEQHNTWKKLTDVLVEEVTSLF
ncbi:MAG: hypothetical protein H7A36_01395 [Chlamydiales bacterium]|nr:hypothetical protein [Chlamydiales bacterium]